MTVVFEALRRRLRLHTAYNLGFGVYWIGWCTAFPLWVLGPRGTLKVLSQAGSPLSWGERCLLAAPVAGAVGTALLPHRSEIDTRVAAVMVGSAAVNAVGEELLWRGVYLDQFPGDVARGAVWPLAGFALWHLAPQRILPATIGRWQFVAAAALVGTASTLPAWRGRGLRRVLLWHCATDACGVTVARFRLG
jgi:hypothetical protein